MKLKSTEKKVIPNTTIKGIESMSGDKNILRIPQIIPHFINSKLTENEHIGILHNIKMVDYKSEPVK